MIYVSVRAALRTRLLALPGVSDDIVAWEGRSFDQPDGQAWYRESLKPQTADLQTLGPLGRIRHEGLYLVDCFAPLDPKTGTAKPTVDVDTAADTVMTHFTPNLQLASGGVTVTVRRVYRAAVQVLETFVQAPVTVAWYADSFNTI